MIGKLSGVIDLISSDFIILEVHDIGYVVYITEKLRIKISLQDKLTLFIETRIRENDISLFGFESLEEKRVFIHLQNVSGVGARIAMSILSILSVEELIFAIVNKDRERLRAISGIGPKLAERILLELSGKFKIDDVVDNLITRANNIATDAISALVSLGMNKIEATNIIDKIIKQHESLSLDQLIKLALQSKK